MQNNPDDPIHERNRDTEKSKLARARAPAIKPADDDIRRRHDALFEATRGGLAHNMPGIGAPLSRDASRLYPATPNGGYVPPPDAVRVGETLGAAGSKMDANKISLMETFFEYFPDAIAAVASVSEYGARKYTRGGWKTVPDGPARYLDAQMRHVLAEYKEGHYDVNDSGLAHAAQNAWNALARLQLLLTAGIIENRRGNDVDPVTRKPILGTALPRR